LMRIAQKFLTHALQCASSKTFCTIHTKSTKSLIQVFTVSI
jgi:hypothetical protein